MSTKTLSKKQVKETSAGKSISAYVILNPSNEHVATVQVAYSDRGNVMVDVWSKSELIYQGKAGGYGYDKFTSALAGAEIDGVKMYDHAVSDEHTKEIIERVKELGRVFESYHLESGIELTGSTFANWDSETQGYKSCYYISGLDRLKAFGYKIIQAI